MANVVINYQEIIALIGSELKKVWEDLVDSENEEIKSVKSIEVSDEQFFRKQESDRTLRRGTVYLVVRFSAGAVNYGSSVVPVSIYGLGVANQVKPVQILLSTFASTWTTLNLGDSENMIQIWNTPEVISNFNIVDEDFRNLYRVSGNIVVGPSAVRLGTLSYIYDEDAYNADHTKGIENVPILSFHDNYHGSVNSVPFGNTKGFSKSVIDFSTYTFGISTYLLSSHLARDVLSIRGLRYRPGGVYPTNPTTTENEFISKLQNNDKIKIKLQFTNDYNNEPGENEQAGEDPAQGSDFFMYYKIVDSQIGQELGSIPTLSITFTR